MSYLRPLYTDAAARAANHNLLSFYLPACLQEEFNTVTSEITNSSEDASTSTYQRDRVPSQRPIDRRWDESRGLIFARKPRNALKDYTWASRDGIVFAREHETRRTLHETRRTYAIRPTPRAPPPPKEKTFSEPTAKPQAQSTPPRGFGGALPSLSRDIPSATNGPKSSKQQEMERQIEKQKTELRDLKAKEAELNQKAFNLEVQLNETKLEAKRDIESAYLRGKEKTESDAQSNLRSLQKERDKAVSQTTDLTSTIATLRNDYNMLKGELENTLVEMEERVRKQKVSMTNDKIRANREVQALEDKHRLDLTKVKNAIQARKEQRKDYISYREIFDNIATDRKNFTDAVLTMQNVLARTHYEARDRLEALQEFCETHPGTGQIGKELVRMASQQQIVAEQTHQGVKSSRDTIMALEDAFIEDAHNSRLMTDTLRFREHQDGARLVDTMYRFVAEVPLANVFSMTNRRITELSKEIKRANNSTVREELARDVQEINALQGPLRVFGQLLVVERERQKLESWKKAPYIRKVTLLRQDQYSKQRKSFHTTFRKETEADISEMPSAQYERRRPLMLEFRFTASKLRSDDRKFESLVARKAQMDVALGRTDREEAAVDREIDALISENKELMMEKLRQLFGDAKGVKALRSRGPAAALAGPSSTRSKVPGFASSSSLAASKARIVAEAEKQVVAAKLVVDRSRNETEKQLAETRLAEARKKVNAASSDLLKWRLERTEIGTEEQRRRWAVEIQRKQSSNQRLERQDAALERTGDAGTGIPTDTTLVSADAAASANGHVSESSSPTEPASEVAAAPQLEVDDSKKSLRAPGSIGRRRPSVVRRHVVSGQAPRGPSARRVYSTGALRASPQHVDNETATNTVANGQQQERVFIADSQDNQQISVSHQEAGTQEPPHTTVTDTTSPTMDESSDFTLSSSEPSVSSSEDAYSIGEESVAPEDEDISLTFHIPAADYRTAIMASKNTSAAFWKSSLYKNVEGYAPVTHYCTTFEQTETQMAKFVNEKVVGFDLEWEMYSSPGKSPIKQCVSLIQIAAEDRIGLFQVSLFKGGDTPDELMPTVLREFLENPNILKAGVNIGNDAKRIQACFGVEVRGIFELSRLYNVVTYSQHEPQKVNRKLVKLADQVQNVLLLPLSKGEVRTSHWSKKLTAQQIEYAVSDAYAGLQLFHALEAKRKIMDPRPPRPAPSELDLPLVLGDGTVVSPRPRVAKKPAAAAAEKVAEDEEESDEEFFDAVENLDPYELGSGKAEALYPDLPSLEGLSISEGAPLETAEDDPNTPSVSATQQQPASAPILSTELAPISDQAPEMVSASTWAATYLSDRPESDSTTTNPPSRPRLLLAYHIWHHQGLDIKGTAALLRDPPLAMATVASYIAEVVKKEQLPFDHERVKEVLTILPKSVHGRYPSIAKAGEAGNVG